MKNCLLSATLLLISFGNVRSETLDEAVTRFLAGEKIDAAALENIYDPPVKPDSEGGEVVNNGSRYLRQVKVSIVDPLKNGGWPWRSTYILSDSRTQKKTYLELKAMYEKNKTPLVAYALVCPAMYVDDMEILPELFAKIADNQPLKARFDEVYAKFWKPRLDPDL